MPSDLMTTALGGMAALILVALGSVGFILWQKRKNLNRQSAISVGRDGSVADAVPSAPPIPANDKIGPTESLVDVVGLVGSALLLKNGTFVRMIEVAPVDLESVDPALKQKYWQRFAEAMKAIRSPLSIQIVISTQPQDIAEYIARWEGAAGQWQLLSERSTDLATSDRRARMSAAAIENAAYLTALNQHLTPMQQRYIVVATFNPFPEAQMDKKREHLLNPKQVKESLDKLEENVQLIRGAFARFSLPLYDLDPATMCQVIWEHYHHPQNILGGSLSPRNLMEEYESLRSGPDDELTGSPVRQLRQCPSQAEFEAAAMNPAALADLLAPALIDEQPNYVRVGDVVGRGYTFFDFDTRAEVDLSALLSFNADMTHALYMTPTDPAIIRQLLRDKETELKSGQVVDQQRGVVTNWGRQNAISSTEHLRAEVEMTMQAPFALHWFCMIWANDVLALERKCQQFETRLKVMGIRFYHATRLHLNLYQSLRPLNRRIFNTEGRNMSADSLGPLFPFARREYYDPTGWDFGMHRGNGLLVCLNAMQAGQSNASQLVLGTPGAGKSIYLKRTVDTLLTLGHRVFVLDPEREYVRLAVDYDGQYIEMGKRVETPAIPLQSDTTTTNDPWLTAWADVREIIESLGGRPLNAEELDALTIHYEAVLAEAGFLQTDPATWDKPKPTLKTLADRLKNDPVGRKAGRVLAYAAEALVGGNQINILDINLDSDTPWQSAMQTLGAFVEVILGRAMEATEFNALVRAFEATMRIAGIDPKDRTTWKRLRPTLAALEKVLASDPDPVARNLASVLFQYSNGIYSDQFNCQTNVDLQNTQFAVFGMRSLRENVEKSLAPVYVWQVLQYAWNAAVANAPSGQPFHLVIDEAWFILQQPGAAARIEAMARSLRKYNGTLIIASQEMSRIVASPEAKAIANVGGIRVLFGQDSEDAARAIADMFGLSQAEQGAILRASKGEGLLIVGNRLRIPIYVTVNPNRLDFLSTNVAQQQAVARAIGRKAEPIL